MKWLNPFLGLCASCGVLAVGLSLATQADAPAAAQLVLIGMVLLVGTFAGRLAECLHLPRLTGYLLIGVALSPGLWALLGRPGMFMTSDQLATLAPATDLAVGVIALMAGSEIKAAWLRERMRALMAITGMEVLLVPTMLTLLIWLLPGISFIQEAVAAGLPAFLVALLAGIVLLPNGPTVVITVITETGATGPLPRMLLGTSALLDALVVLLFTVVVSLLGAASGSDHSAHASSAWAALASAGGGMAGSLVLGAILGLALRLHAERSGTRLGWAVLGCALGVAALAPVLGIKPLFCLLAAGFAFGNLPGSDPTRAERAHARLHAALADVGMPVFVVFFCAAGLSVDVYALLSGWMVVAGLLVARDALIWSSIRLATRQVAVEPAVRQHLWLGMVSQAGVTLALAQIVRTEFPGWGGTLASFVVAMVTLHEIWVPVALARALRSTMKDNVTSV
jgi:Kef-type K+ transport system membrane component KefB